MKETAKQFAKFSVVGGSAFFIDYATMLMLVEVFNANYLLATTVGFLVALVYNYFFSMRFVFHRRNDISRKREFITFAVLSVIGLILNDVLMFCGTSLVDIDYRITKIAVAAIVSIFNFVTRKIFLEQRIVPEENTPAA